MTQRENALVFLSGRLVALAVLLGFQIVLVRILPTRQYGVYSLVFAFATLMQTAVSFGIPRVIPKYISQAGWRYSFRAMRHLAAALIAARVVGSFLLMTATTLAALEIGYVAGGDRGLLISAGLYILSSLVQSDSDAMAQALMLQRISRICTIGEPTARLVLVAWQAWRGHIHGAQDIFFVSLSTSAFASAVLVAAVFRTLSQRDVSPTYEVLKWVELRATALGGYASSMAWFASSPAVIRLIGSYFLSIPTFAGFAFSQSLVLSFQRYTPGTILFPFIEPTVIKSYLKTGDLRGLESALSLVTKIDIILVGATVVGTIIAGRPIVDILTGGRYGREAFALACLLTYIVTSSVYRSFEIVAIALSASAALIRALSFSLIWLAITLLLARKFGIYALLFCPLGDAASRLILMYGALHRVGIRRVVDLRVLSFVGLLIAVFGVLGLGAASFAPGRTSIVVIGTLAMIAFLGCVTLLKPLRAGEAAFLVEPDRRGWIPDLVRRSIRDGPV